MERDPATQIDRLTSAVLEFAAGTATFTCGTQIASYQRVNVFGTSGRIEIEIPFNAPPDRPCRIWLQTGAELLMHKEGGFCKLRFIFFRHVSTETGRFGVYADVVTVLAQLEQPERVILFEIEPNPAAATDVRARIGSGEPLDGLAPPAVATLISERGLYRP